MDAPDATRPASTFAAVRACALAILAGAILHASDVTAGNGVVVDWRTERSGATLATEADPFDAAQLFVALVGPEAALSSLEDVPTPAPEPTPIATRISAYCIIAGVGGRRRSFDAPQGFTVYVEPHEEDAVQAAFTARLAAFCDEAAS